MPPLNYSLLVSRFIGSGQWERALETGGEWLASDPENIDPHRAVGQALINLQRHREAEPHLLRVLAGAPEDDFALRLMSIVYFATGRSKQADEAMRRAIELQPNDALHWYQLSHMSYEQGDLALARTYAEQAQRLNPLDPNVLNMLGLCDSGEGDPKRQRELRRYLEALELDPENAVLHNNVGVHHLNHSGNRVAAEACFRTALSLEPTNQLARQNLLLVVKQRDPFYRLLCAPRDFMAGAFAMMGRARQRSILLYALMIPLWLFAVRFFIAGLVLWCLLVWPMVKVYERLTIGDLSRRAGEIGAHRGGWLGYRGWPRWVRMTLFAVALLSFWGGLALALRTNNELLLGLLGLAIAMVLPVILFRILRKWYREARNRAHTRRRKRELRTLLKP